MYSTLEPKAFRSRVQNSEKKLGAGSKVHGKEYIIHVADPAAGLLKYTESEFLKCWYSTKNEGVQEGTELLLEPTPDICRQEDEEKGKLKFMYLLNYIKPYSKYIFQLMLGMLTASIISLIFPYLTQSLVDVGIGNSNISFVVMVLVAQLILSLSQTANGLLRNWISLHITSRVSISLISGFLIKLMKLPISFFDVKLIGDVMLQLRRFQVREVSSPILN